MKRNQGLHRSPGIYQLKECVLKAVQTVIHLPPNEVGRKKEGKAERM